MNGGVRPAVLKVKEPSPAVEVVSSAGDCEESLRYTMPATGAPVAATPVTELTAAGPLAPPPPPHPENNPTPSAVRDRIIALHFDITIISPLSVFSRHKNKIKAGALYRLFDNSATRLSR